MYKIIDVLKKHRELFTVLGLLVLCYFIFFFDIGTYALMDVDETRYVSMARDMFHSKDFLTLYLNHEYFFEKPPLYFWGECLSFAIFGKVTEFTARFPVALYGTLSTLLTYLVGKKVVSRRYGVISALILATTLEFVILAKFAILDIVVTTCVGFSILFGLLTQFAKEKHVALMWWLFYIFSGLAVMAKGLPGFIVPFAVMFFVTIANKSFKKIFQPKYFVVGFILFFLIVIPWHLVMFKIHDPLFFQEYIIKHHLERFLNSNEIGREQPFYFYIITLIWGLIPWIFSAIATGISKIVEIFKIKSIKNFDIQKLSRSQKFLLFNVIGFVVTLLFFSSSSTKLITYILPIYFFTSNILGFIWEDYIFNNKYKKAINITVYAFGSFALIFAIAACFMQEFLPTYLYNDIVFVKWCCISLLVAFGSSSIFFALKNNPKGVFASYVLFMVIASAYCTKTFYNIDYKFGQDELMQFTKDANEHNQKIIVLNNERKYSVLYYNGYHKDQRVFFITLDDKAEMKQEGFMLDDKDVVVIIKNKQIEEIDKVLNFNTIKKGEKYSLIKVY